MIQCLLLFFPAHIFHGSRSLKKVCVLILDLCEQNFLGISYNFVLHTFLLYTVSRLCCNTHHLYAAVPMQMRKWRLVWWAWVNSSQAVTLCYFCTCVGKFFPKPSWRTWQSVSTLMYTLSSIYYEVICWPLVTNIQIFSTVFRFTAVEVTHSSDQLQYLHVPLWTA